MRVILYIFCMFLLQLPVHADSDIVGKGVKEISSMEFLAIAVAYSEALPELKKRGRISSSEMDFEFNIEEEKDVYKIFILSAKKEARGGDIEYWIDKNNLKIKYSKFWK